MANGSIGMCFLRSLPTRPPYTPCEHILLLISAMPEKSRACWPLYGITLHVNLFRHQAGAAAHEQRASVQLSRALECAD